MNPLSLWWVGFSPGLRRKSMSAPEQCGSVLHMSDLAGLRSEIEALDRRMLETLNRRLELVAAVRRHKDAAGERWIDPEREAELLQSLVAANGGPLSERGV